MLNRIKDVEYLSDYKLKLTFTNNKKKIVNLKKYKTKDKESVYYPFNDLNFFMSVKLDKRLGTIVWPNGIDFCPDALYERGKDINESHKKVSHKKRASSMSEKPQIFIAARGRN